MNNTEFRDGFDRHEVIVLRAAVNRARQILSKIGVEEDDQPGLGEELARDVVSAARSGNINLLRLSNAACARWFKPREAA